MNMKNGVVRGGAMEEIIQELSEDLSQMEKVDLVLGQTQQKPSPGPRCSALLFPIGITLTLLSLWLGRARNG